MPNLHTLLTEQHPLLMAVVNVSSESFYKGSIGQTEDELSEFARRAEEEGADILDIGAMSTAPYKETQISEDEEAERLDFALGVINRTTSLPLSVDTSRIIPLRAALAGGASILNDVQSLSNPDMLETLAGEKEIDIVLMANEAQAPKDFHGSPERLVFTMLKSAKKRALSAGINESRLILDPGIGFFRNQPQPWFNFDLELIKNLELFNELGSPLLVSASRKSFLGELLGRKNPDDRLPGSLAAAWACLDRGASIIRTHDVKETRDVIEFWKLTRSNN